MIVTVAGWIVGTHMLLHTCAETDVCFSNVPIFTQRHDRKMFITGSNSHNSLFKQL